MKRVNIIFNSITFRRIVVIFTVGLISRILVNLAFDINVFKEYTNLISLTYYGLIACFVGYLSDVPKISFNVFDIKWIANAIKSYYENMFLGDKMKLGDPVTNYKKDFKVRESRDRLFNHRSDGSNKSKELDREYSRVPSRRPAAALRGLYDPA
jgi:hypothetical protein